MSVTTVILLFGGLGLFLYGMQMMSESLERVAGDRMRSILEFFTKNRFIGMIVGIVFTAIIQSSNATTVMVVSFVNSGLMTLMQSAGVILGANIGTTITGQLIAFNLSDIAPLFVITGVVMAMFSKKQNVKKIGNVILGFGILFMGLSTMGSAMSGLKDSPQVISWLQTLSNPLIAVLVGFGVTAVLQSSSATVGILILLSTQGLIDPSICLFIILGCNIGSCVSALLASISGNKDAKRAAWIHFLFNIIGTVIIFIALIVAFNPIYGALASISGSNPGRVVANAHSLIKIVEVIILFPFMGYVVKATYKIIPGEDKKDNDELKYELKYIGDHTRLSNNTIVIDVIRELERMGNIAIDNLRRSMDALCNLDKEKIDQVYKVEGYIDYLNKEITNYLVRVSGMDIPMSDASLVGGLFHVANDIERIGDHAENFADSAKSRLEHGIEFSEKGKQQLQDMTDMVVKTLEFSLDMFSHRSQEHMQEVIALEDSVDEKERKLQQSHVKRLAKGTCSPEAGMLFSDTASGLERVADHATNIAFAIMEPQDVNDSDDEE